MSEKMALPKSWILTSVDEICDFYAGFGFPTEMQGISGQELPFYKVKDVSIAWLAQSVKLIETENSLSLEESDRIKAKPVPEGTVVFAKIGEALRLNRRAIAPRACLIDNNLMGIHAPSTRLASQFLFWFTLVTRFDVDARASVVPSIRKSDVGSLPFPLPPLAEQTRIVAKLEELLSDLDAGVAELKAAQKKLKQYRQSLLKAAVEGALTAEWRQHHAPAETGAALLQRILQERRARWETKQLAKFKEQGKTPPKDWQKKCPEPVQPDVTGLPVLPEGWAWASIEQIASDEKYSLAIGPFGSNLTVPDYRDSGVPLIFVRNIRSGRYGDGYTKYVTEEKAKELCAHSVQAGDVLITKMGEPPGDADVYPENQPVAIITADCIKVRCWLGLIRPEFLKAVINSYIGKKQIEPITQGVAQKKVSLGRFTGLAVPVAPIEEQDKMISLFSAANTDVAVQEAAINLALKQSTAQRQNILRAAFAGELVPQDPNDEPAAVLLARIRAERAVADAVKSRRGNKTKVTP